MRERPEQGDREGLALFLGAGNHQAEYHDGGNGHAAGDAFPIRAPA